MSVSLILDNDMANLLGILRRLQTINFVQKFTTFNNNLVHSDLLHNDENLFSGEPSSVIGCFDNVGQPLGRVNYY